MKEPIQHFFNNYGFNKKEIHSIITGEKYIGLLLKNGNIGVCSTLNQKIEISALKMNNPILEDLQHRIILNAYYNAKLNYRNTYERNVDIFDAMDFKKYDNIVMIGFFRSLVKKFENERIPLTIFDKLENDPILVDMDEQKQHLIKAQCIILSGTTIFNNTFMDIVNSTSANSDIFLLGPSNILHRDMLKYRNIRVVFGSIFNKYDIRVFDQIKAGGGTPSFLQYLKKVYLSEENNEVSL